MKKILFALALVIFSSQIAQARTQGTVSKGVFEPVPIALHGFAGTTPQQRGVNNELIEVISNNLGGTGLFDILDESSFLERMQPGQIQPNFEAWKQIGAKNLVTGAVKRADNIIEIEFRLWNVLSGQQIAGTAFSTTRKGLRRIAHQISDQIYTRLTGEGAYFDSRIVYVAENGPKNRRIKRLAIMDQDGFNHQYITGGKSLVLTPRFTPEDQKVIYLSYAAGPPKVRLLEIETGRENVIGNFPGMTFAPRYNRRGDKLLMSVANNGNTEIHELSPHSKVKRKLTNNPAIDTSPFYSPDETQIVFSSDRGGSQQLYIMDTNGNGVKRITFGKGNYSSPVWSPRGDYIAFTKQANGQFYIGVIRPDGSGERLLTSSYLVESPSWSPNGRVIVFTRQVRGGRSRLYSVDITGYNERLLKTPGDGSDPTWSPLLK